MRIPDDVITESGHLISDSGDQITPSERSDDNPSSPDIQAVAIEDVRSHIASMMTGAVGAVENRRP
jgi:hypothetical protein